MNNTDTWANGDAYEPFMGRWSRLAAGEFLSWLGMPPGSDWLEVGCGTGAFTETILRQMQPGSVTSIDPSEGFVVYAREHVQDARASFKVGDASALLFPDETFSAVVSGLVLNFIPDQEKALAEMVRVTQDSGVVAAYVWDYADGMQMLRIFWDTAVELDPAVAEKGEDQRFPVCKPEPLLALFNGAGLKNVEVRAIDVHAHFRDFDEYWLPFLGGQGPAPSYVMSLDQEARTTLREHVRSKLPVAPDGSISLIVRAWAVRGSKL